MPLFVLFLAVLFAVSYSINVSSQNRVQLNHTDSQDEQLAVEGTNEMRVVPAAKFLRTDRLGRVGISIGVFLFVLFSLNTPQRHMPIPLTVDPHATIRVKPHIKAFDGCRFILVNFINIGSFAPQLLSNIYLIQFLSQHNSLVGALFVLSGYVCAYSTTEVGERACLPRLNHPFGFAMSRMLAYLPMYWFVLVIFAPMFIWIDVQTVSWKDTGLHGFLAVSLLQAWDPSHNNCWNEPTWYLSALAFAIFVMPFVLSFLASLRVPQLRGRTIVVASMCVVFAVIYSYVFNVWEKREGFMHPSLDAEWIVFNVLRTNPIYIFLEMFIGAAACRIVMLDSVEEAAANCSPMWPLATLFTVISLRGCGILVINDVLARAVLIVPLTGVSLMRIHRQTVLMELVIPNDFIIPNVLGSDAMASLAKLCFPIFILHAPLGQIFYGDAVAGALWGGKLSASCFPAYWGMVMLCSYFMWKVFVGSERWKRFETALTV